MNRSIIRASVAEKNLASIKALESVDYFQTGKKLRVFYRNGEYTDENLMAWFNPNRISDLYPKGLPEKYSPYVEKAKKTLTLARETVILL